MKALMYLVILGAIAYGGYYGYEHYYDKDAGRFVFPWSEEAADESAEDEVTEKMFEVKTRRCIVVTRDGRKLYKTYKDTARYAYPKGASAKEKSALKKAAYTDMMKKLVAEADSEKERIAQFLAYYKDIEKHLRTVANASFVKIDEGTLNTIKELRSQLRKAGDTYHMLSKEEELEKEATLSSISRALLVNQKNKKIKEIARAFSDWHGDRLENYPEVSNVLASYKGHRSRR